MIILPHECTRADERSAIGRHDRGLTRCFAVNWQGALRQIFPREMSARLVDDLDRRDATTATWSINYDGELLIGGRLFVGGKAIDGQERVAACLQARAARAREGLLAARPRDRGGDRGGRNRPDGSRRKRKQDGRPAVADHQGRSRHSRSADPGPRRPRRDRRGPNGIARSSPTRPGRSSAEIAELKEKRAEAVENKQAADSCTHRGDSRTRKRSAPSLNEARSKTDAANAVLNEKRMVAATSDERRRSAVSRASTCREREQGTRIAACPAEPRAYGSRGQDQGPPRLHHRDHRPHRVGRRSRSDRETAELTRR